MHVKDIFTKYATFTPKNKKEKNDVDLTKDPNTGKVIEEVASYRQKEGSCEVEVKDFKVTTMDLGVLTRDMNNHIF